MSGNHGARLTTVAEIRDPIHGYIMITDVERKLIDTAIFQRLHYIRQLAGAYYVYPGADHTRFGHSLGVMHLAGIMGDHLANLGYIDLDDVQMLRIAGLLHDLGHGPFSHVYEELLVVHTGKTHEDMTQWLILNTEIKDILNDEGYEPNKIADLAVGKLSDSDKSFLNRVISSPFDVDKMDFLVRDSYFTGVEYGYIDVYRLIYSSNVVDNELAIKVPAALYALEAFIIARYEMFKAVYFHRTVRSSELLLLKSMDYACDELNLINIDDPEEYMKLTDSWVITKLKELSMRSNITKKEIKLAVEFYKMLEKRDLLKCAYETVLHIQAPVMSNIIAQRSIRNKIEEEIALRSGVDSEYIILDMPSVPSIPYTPRQNEPFEIPVYEIVNGVPRRRRLTDISSLINVLRGYVDVLRVYTTSKFRQQVSKAARDVLGEPSSLLSVSL
ncbi:MAG: HD domain-containing protein [Thermoprotei archaeon]|nr:HD domain-containing protein [Thermoprotei archaeon]